MHDAPKSRSHTSRELTEAELGIILRLVTAGSCEAAPDSAFPATVSSLIAEHLSGAVVDAPLHLSNDYHAHWHMDLDRLPAKAWRSIAAAFVWQLLEEHDPVEFVGSRWVIVARGGAMYEIAKLVSDLISAELPLIPVLGLWEGAGKVTGWNSQLEQDIRGRKAILLEGVVNTGLTLLSDSALIRSLGVTIKHTYAVVASDQLGVGTRNQVQSLVTLALDRCQCDAVQPPSSCVTPDLVLKEQDRAGEALREFVDLWLESSRRPVIRHRVEGGLHYPQFFPLADFLGAKPDARVVRRVATSLKPLLEGDGPHILLVPYQVPSAADVRARVLMSVDRLCLTLQGALSDIGTSVPVMSTPVEIGKPVSRLSPSQVAHHRVIVTCGVTSMGSVLRIMIRDVLHAGATSASALALLNRQDPATDEAVRVLLHGRWSWAYELRAPASVRCRHCEYKVRLTRLSAPKVGEPPTWMAPLGVRRGVEALRLTRQGGQRLATEALMFGDKHSLAWIAERDRSLARLVVQHAFYRSSSGFDVRRIVNDHLWPLDDRNAWPVGFRRKLLRVILQALPHAAMDRERQTWVETYLSRQVDFEEFKRLAMGLLESGLTSWVLHLLRLIAQVSTSFFDRASCDPSVRNGHWDLITLFVHEYLASRARRQERTAILNDCIATCRNDANARALTSIRQELGVGPHGWGGLDNEGEDPTGPQGPGGVTECSEEPLEQSSL